MVGKLTTILIVEAIEPVIGSWERLGFTKAAEVPHGDKLGFVILNRDGIELMLQTKASLREDLGIDPPSFALYAEVSSLEEARTALAGAGKVIIERRVTFYGATECWVRDGAGTLIGFAMHGVHG